MNDEMKITSNCPLCEEHALHVIGDKDKLMQCLYCGYVSSDKFSGIIMENDEYKKLPKQMQQMAKEHNGRIWIPTVMTLPMGVLNPILVENKMMWAYSPMVDIPEDEQENYPDGNGGFYEKKYDSEQVKLFSEFHVAISELNKEVKSEKKELKLPKLQRID